MRVLLDTHALLWFLSGDAALSAAARGAIEDSANEKFVSHASAWEIAIKVSIGKLELLVPFEEVFPRAVLANGFGVLPPSFGHYRRLIGLPWHHRDPFDRLIAVQALAEGMAIVSSDAMFDAYGVQRIW